MTSKEIIQQLETIHSERFLATFHDDINITNAPDLQALGRAIKVLKYLAEHSGATLSVKKIFSDCKIEV